MKIEIKKLDRSEVEILGVLPYEDFAKYEEKALSKISERLELPGFRKGKVPNSVVKENVTEMMILEEMAEQALYSAYPKIIEEYTIDAIGRPMIAITKIAKGIDLEFKIITAVLPEMKLPDYKKLSADIIKKNPIADIVVDKAEVEKIILELKETKASEKFPNADAFKEKIKSNLKIEKETIEKDKLRLAIVEELLKESKGDIPEILIDSEVDKILYRLQSDIANMGFKFDEYLIQIKKTEEELRKEWRADAEKRSKLQMIIHTISNKEKLKPSEEEIEKEASNITAMYKDADPARARAYVENMLENEKVFKFLENQ